MSLFKRIAIFAALTMAVSVGHGDQSSYGKSKHIVTTSILEKLDKNFGKLSVGIETSCQATEDQSLALINETIDKVRLAVSEKMATMGLPEPSLQKGSEKVFPKNRPMYSLEWPDSEDSLIRTYFSPCPGKAPVPLSGISPEEISDIEAMVSYGSRADLIFEASQNIESLIDLKKHLKDLEIPWNNESEGLKVSVADSPVFSVDEKTLSEAQEGLLERLSYESQDTMMSEDESFHKQWTGVGYDVKTITTLEKARPTYTTTFPVLSGDDGVVSLTKTFYFDVSYIPTNLGNDKSAVIPPKEDQFPETVSVELLESDVESFASKISVSTQCQTSRKNGKLVFETAFGKAVQSVRTEMLQGFSPDANRVEFENIVDPKEYYPYQVSEKKRSEVTQIVTDKEGQQKEVVVTKIVDTHYRDLCTNELIEAKDRKPYWKASQTFTALTDSFQVYKSIQGNVSESLGEINANGKLLSPIQVPLIEAQKVRRPVTLKDSVWRQKVDVELYRKALDQLTSPQGKVARYLFSPQIAASSAYYKLGVRKISQGDIILESAHGKLAFSGDGAAPQEVESYTGGKLDTESTDLERYDVFQAIGYEFVTRPRYDMIYIIKKRAKAEGVMLPGMN